MPHPNLPQHPTIHVLRHYAKLRRVDEDLGQNLTNAGVKPPLQLYPGVRYAILEQQRKVRGVGWVPAISLFILSQLNPHNVPWAFSQLGVAVATLIVAALACITGLCYFLVWKAFLEIDSIHYPAKTMQILAERVLGRPLGALVGLAQGVQLLMMASSLILSTSRLLSNIANGVGSEGAAGIVKLCFTVILAIAAGVAVLSTAIRRMRRFKFGSPIVIFLLLASAVVVMWSAKHTGAAESQINLQQVTFSGFINSSSSFREKVRAAMQLALAFGGGLCLVEIMGETRRPSEFGKSLAVGQALIAILYIIFGPVVYTVLGQFTSLPSYFGLASTGAARTIKGIILITNLGAMALFGNIGAKLLFNNLVDRFGGPLLLSTSGRYMWYALASLFWGSAFIVVAVVPQTGIVIRFVSTLLILPFSVAIPASVALIFLVKRDAAQMDVFDASTLEIKASDAWEDGSRWRRGFAPQWALKLLLAVFVVLALSVTGVGGWVAWLDLKQAVDRGTTMAIGCSPPATSFFYPIR